MLKIDARVREAFERQEQVAERLGAEVNRDLTKRKHSSWHYESRVKSLESFALKVETGRIESLKEVEDVFAATIVVPDATQVAEAEAIVTQKYTLKE